MRIGQLADAAGTTSRAVRHYHRLGLMTEPTRLSNGYREYSMSDVVRLMRIRWLADAGIPLGSIATILSGNASGEDSDDVSADLRALIGIVESEQAKLARRRSRLAAMLADVERGHPISALPSDVAAAVEAAIDGAPSPSVAASLRRERDLLEVLAISGNIPEDSFVFYAAVLADEDRRPRYLTVLGQWADLEGKDPDLAEPDIDQLSRELAEILRSERSLVVDDDAIAPDTFPETVVALEDVIPDPAQREVVLRVQRALVDGLPGIGSAR